MSSEKTAKSILLDGIDRLNDETCARHEYRNEELQKAPFADASTVERVYGHHRKLDLPEKRFA